MKPRVLGILGFSQTGKDSVAHILMEEQPFVRVAFADELKRFVMKLFEFTVDQMWGASKEMLDERYPRNHTMVWNADTDALQCLCCKTTDPKAQCYLTGRYALQIFGTEGGRHCYEDLWVNKTLGVASRLNAGGYTYSATQGLVLDVEAAPKSVIVSDLRFVSEVEGLRKRGFEVYRIKRIGYEKPVHDHPSETEQLQIPDEETQGVILNYGTLEDLREQVIEVILRK